MLIETVKEFFAFWKEKPLVLAVYGASCFLIGALVGAVFS